MSRILQIRPQLIVFSSQSIELLEQFSKPGFQVDDCLLLSIAVCLLAWDLLLAAPPAGHNLRYSVLFSSLFSPFGLLRFACCVVWPLISAFFRRRTTAIPGQGESLRVPIERQMRQLWIIANIEISSTRKPSHFQGIHREIEEVLHTCKKFSRPERSNYCLIGELLHVEISFCIIDCGRRRML